MTRSRSPLASGAGLRKQRSRRRPPWPDISMSHGTPTSPTGSGSCTRALGRPTTSPRTWRTCTWLRRPSCGRIRIGLRWRLRREPVDTVGQYPQRPRRVPPRLDARPRRIRRALSLPSGRMARPAVLSPISSPPRSPTDTGSRTNGSTEWGTGTASSSMRPRIRSCSPGRCGGRGPVTCTAVRRRRHCSSISSPKKPRAG